MWNVVPIFFNLVQFRTQCLLYCYVENLHVLVLGRRVHYLLIDRNVLDVGALVAEDESTSISNIEEEEKAICKLEKSMEKSNNVANEYKEMEKVLTGLVGAIKEVCSY